MKNVLAILVLSALSAVSIAATPSTKPATKPTQKAATKPAAPITASVDFTKPGSVGLIGRDIDVVQIIDDGNFIGTIRFEGTTIWVTEIDTAKMNDESSIMAEKLIWQYVAPKSYTTALGTKKTIPMLKIVSKK